MDPRSCENMPTTALSNTRKFGNSTFQIVNDPDTGDKESFRAFLSNFGGFCRTSAKLDKIVQFHQVREVDEGFYRCTATNLAGSVSSEVVEINTGNFKVFFLFDRFLTVP